MLKNDKSYRSVEAEQVLAANGARDLADTRQKERARALLLRGHDCESW